MDRESASTVLATPLAQQLLHSSPLAHLAYIGRDGYPRVIPTGYVWKGGKFVVCTPDNAPKVRSLGSNPRVALTIDTQTQPPRILLVRGTASMEFMDRVPNVYPAASPRYVWARLRVCSRDRPGRGRLGRDRWLSESPGGRHPDER